MQETNKSKDIVINNINKEIAKDYADNTLTTRQIKDKYNVGTARMLSAAKYHGVSFRKKIQSDPPSTKRKASNKPIDIKKRLYNVSWNSNSIDAKNNQWWFKEREKLNANKR